MLSIKDSFIPPASKVAQNSGLGYQKKDLKNILDQAAGGVCHRGAVLFQPQPQKCFVSGCLDAVLTFPLLRLCGWQSWRDTTHSGSALKGFQVPYGYPTPKYCVVRRGGMNAFDSISSRWSFWAAVTFAISLCIRAFVREPSNVSISTWWILAWPRSCLSPCKT